MKRTIIQIYEIQEPREAEALIECGVDHIGSVLIAPEAWKVPAIREVIRLVRQSSAKSTLIPLLPKTDDVLRALDYYTPDFVHFCERIPLAGQAQKQREGLCTELIRIQQLIKKEFPPVGIIRSIPIPEPGLAEPEQVKEAILTIARTLGPAGDFFMTDTLRGFEEETAVQPVAGYVGITGEICDWDLAAALVAAAPIPVILAGGIAPENVFEAIHRVRPAGIDSCTQTNARDARGKPIRFRKDMGRIRRLIDEVRRADAE
jgi:phosphoribosylanthranilate isomerase